MIIQDDKGYGFEVLLNACPKVHAEPDLCFVRVFLRAPNSVFGVRERHVERFTLEDLVLFLRGMLDGLVEEVDPESAGGYVQFDDLLLGLRRVPSSDSTVSFEVQLRDCGCGDDRTFSHGAFMTVSVDRDVLAAEVDLLEEDIWAVTSTLPGVRRA